MLLSVPEMEGIYATGRKDGAGGGGGGASFFEKVLLVEFM